MKGLIKNNYYKSIFNLRLLIGAILILGIVIINFDKSDWMDWYMYLCVVGISVITCLSLVKYNSGKWNQYLITMPILRKNIVGSVYLCQLISMIVGIVISSMVLALLTVIYGFPLYRELDIVLIYSSGISSCLFMAAIFFPIVYIDNRDRVEIIGILSLLLSIAIEIGIVFGFNYLMDKPTNTELLIESIIMLVIATLIYSLSYYLSIRIYLKKEF